MHACPPHAFFARDRPLRAGARLGGRRAAVWQAAMRLTWCFLRWFLRVQSRGAALRGRRRERSSAAESEEGNDGFHLGFQASLVSALAVWRIYDQTGGDGTLLLVHRVRASQNQMSLKTGRFPRKRRRGTPGTAKIPNLQPRARRTRLRPRRAAPPGVLKLILKRS